MKIHHSHKILNNQKLHISLDSIYPRIVFYKTYTKSYDSITNRKDIFYSNHTSFIVGAGACSVDLGKSTYRYQKNKKGEDSYIEKGYCIMN